MKNIILKRISVLLICVIAAASLSACGSVKELVTPDVQLGELSFPVDSESVTAVLTAEDLELLDSFTALKELDLSGSSCYSEIMSWVSAHPDVNVKWSIEVPGIDGALSPDTAKLDLSALSGSDALGTTDYFCFLPELKEVELGKERSGLSLKDASALAAEYPGMKFDFSFSFNGEEHSLYDTVIDLSELAEEDVDKTAETLSCMPAVERVILGDDKRENVLSWAAIRQLRDACPNAAFDYSFTLYDREFTLEDSEVDINHTRLYDDGALVREVCACMPNLSFLCMDTCNVSNEKMAEIRDEFPNAEVVWRINFGTSYSVRTNETRILASCPSLGGNLYPHDYDMLKYCTKVKYLDLGHNENLLDCSFVYSMPDLEVLIIAMNPISDISPLASCKNLEYLEIFYTNVTDLTPLSGLTNLKHINIGFSYELTDLSPLYGLKQLERLYVGCRTSVTEETFEEAQAALPNTKIDKTSWDTSTGDWRFTSEFDNDPEYMSKDYYHKGQHPRYALLRQQFKYDGLHYSVGWEDPYFFSDAYYSGFY